MAAIAPITVMDGKATPVAHALNPVQSAPSAIWREQKVGLSQIGQIQLTVTRTTVTKELDKVRLVFSVPALEVTSGANASGYSAAPKVAYEDKADIAVFLPARATSDQHKDLRVMLSNALLNAQIADIIDNGAVAY